MHCSQTLSWASGLLPASRSWEELGAIEVTVSPAAGLFFALALFACSHSLALPLAGWSPVDHLLFITNKRFSDIIFASFGLILS